MIQIKNVSRIVGISFLTIGLYANAGGMEGGGGNSVVCRNMHGQMVSAEIYDLFEGRALYGYLPKLETEDYKTQARAIAKKLTESSANDFFVTETERILNEVKFLPTDAELIPIDDSGSIIKPSNCDIFQAAIYQANQRIYFDSNIWNLLNETNRAALVSHEVVYAFMRIYDNAKTSVRARQYVSFIYSGQNLLKRWLPAEGEHFEVCKTNYDDPMNNKDTPVTSFYNRVNPDGTWKISFNYFNGLKVLGLTEINSRSPQYGYSWPIALHNVPGGIPGGYGVGLDEKLEVVVDEGWSVANWYLDHDSNSNYLSVQSSGKWNKIYFSCQPINF